MFRYLLLLLSFLSVMSMAGEAYAKVWTYRCMAGKTNMHEQTFPQESLGAVPNRILNWELHFITPGRYAIRISNWLDFEPFVYRKSSGKYVWAGLNRQTKRVQTRDGRYYYTYVFTVQHNRLRATSSWLLQMKPRDQYREQKMRIYISDSMCAPGVGPKKKMGPQCPPGQYFQDAPFGQGRCVPYRR